MTTESFGTVNDVIYPKNDLYENLIYLVDNDHKELTRQYNEIKGKKHIVSAYSINGRHVLVLNVIGKVKKIIKRKQ